MTTYYLLGDESNESASSVMRMLGVQYRAKATGEFRAPKKGEWYLSGAIVTAYYAPNDLTTEFHIAKIVKVRKVEYWEEVE